MSGSDEITAAMQRIVQRNREARDRFAGFSQRVFKAIAEGSDVGGIVSEFIGQGEEGGTEQVEAGDLGEDSGSQGVAGGTEGEREEPTSGEPSDPPKDVGQ
jgi:hypothetical protein